MPENTRREFLRLVAAASLAATHARFALGKPTTTAQAWVTSKDCRFEEFRAGDWRNFCGESPTGIVVDPTKRCQEILEFGGAFTDATCYVLSQMEPDKRQALPADLFTNPGAEQKVLFQAGKQAMELALGPDSVTSVRW